MRTNRINEARLDPGSRRAYAGAGSNWGQVQAMTSPHGLTAAAGSAPAVGVTGYTLGGGLSWFARRYGWASDSVTAFDIIGAQGRAKRVTASADPELFWALRGGGGDYALVTGTEFTVHPAPALYGGRMLWPAAQAPQVLAAFRDLAMTAPDELTLWWALFRFGGPPMVGIDVTYLGNAATAGALLRPLERIGRPVRDTRRALPIAELGTITAEPTAPSPIYSHVELLSDLTDADANALLTLPMDPVVTIQLRRLGGRLAQPSDTPAAAVSSPYSISFIAPQPTPNAAAANIARVQEYLRALDRSRSRRTPFSLLSPTQQASDAFTPATLTRLRAIKGRTDPGGVFRSNFPVLD